MKRKLNKETVSKRQKLNQDGLCADAWFGVLSFLENVHLFPCRLVCREWDELIRNRMRFDLEFPSTNSWRFFIAHCERLCNERVRSVSINHDSSDSADEMYEKIELMNNLEKLSISGCREENYHIISKHCRNLKVTHLEFAGFDGQDLQTLSTLPLKYFGLYHTTLTKDDAMEISRLSGLTSLSLINCDADILPYLDGLPLLIHLDLTQTPTRGLDRLSNNLTSLSLAGSHVEPDEIVHLTKLTSLTYLDLSDNVTREQDIINLSKLKNLTTLRLCACRVASSWVKHLAQLDELRHLDLSLNSLGQDVGHLTTLQKLETLKLHSCLISEGIRGLDRLKYLTHLDLSGNAMSGESIAHLSGCTQLTHLDLINNNVRHLSHLSPLINLKSLQLNTFIGLGALSHLSNLINMTSLSIRVSQLNDEDVKVLNSMTQLEKLELLSCMFSSKEAQLNLPNLTRLKMTNCNSVRDLYQLKNLNALTHLNLNDSQLGDDGAHYLLTLSENGSLSRLKILTALSNQFSEKGIEYLNSVKSLKKIEIDNDYTIKTILK